MWGGEWRGRKATWKLADAGETRSAELVTVTTQQLKVPPVLSIVISLKSKFHLVASSESLNCDVLVCELV